MKQQDPSSPGQPAIYRLVVACTLLVVSASSRAVSVTGFGTDVNAFLGADRFYTNGYNGSSAIMANIEAGHVWNGHDTLTHATTRVTGTGALGSTSSHATQVGAAMGGRATATPGSPESSPLQSGIAAGAELWSGAIATGFGSGNSFSVSLDSVASTYSTILQAGVNGKTATVFNSSWSGIDTDGFNIFTFGIDGLINDNGSVGVFSAGNEGGSGTGTVASPGAGFNAITVGALAYPYEGIAGFSSRSPTDVVHALTPNSGVTLSGVRAAVDITAPGTDLTLATTGGASAYATNLDGTSYAAPIVAGGAALVVDAGHAAYAGNDRATDGRVVKAVLLNAADKTAGWDNGQHDVGGVTTTTQSLDWTLGAGRMNLDTTYDQYLDAGSGGRAGTADVAGLGRGDLGNVAEIGWDFGEVDELGSNDYFIDRMLLGGSWLDATLSWFVDRATGNLANFSGAQEEHFADLNLSLFSFDNLIDRNITQIIAQSISVYNVVEHLHFLLPGNGFYGLRVDYAGDNWDFIAADLEQYGLAWSATALGRVPAPVTLVLLAGGLALIHAAHRRRSEPDTGGR